jgi:peptidoglycan/xylan/chitin deacetylase (PgdA/CDA1 family)/general stress protein CsbA
MVLAVALAAFVLVVAANEHMRSVLTLVLVFAGVALGVASGRWIGTRSVVAAVVGGFVAVAALWLVTQRDDTAAAVILAVLFGGGAAVALGTDRSHPARASTGVVALVALTAIFAAYIGAETPDATWFGGGTIHGPTNRNEVALTFDDGPNIGASREIAKILDEHGVKGTFFEVGKAIDAEPAITRALYDDGHLLGNHSYHHDEWRWLDPRYPELERTQKAFQRAIGTCPVLYRPPHGDRTPFLARVVRDAHMHMVLWSASAGDWATNDPALIARRIVDQARPGSILLLHDGLDGKPDADRDVLVRAMPMILDGLERKHLTPVRLDQMLGVPAYQPC